MEHTTVLERIAALRATAKQERKNAAQCAGGVALALLTELATIPMQI